MAFIVLTVFMAFIGVIALSAIVRLCIQSKYISWNAIKREIFAKSAVRWWTFPVTLVFLGIFLFFYQIAFNSTATVMITLNYSEAYKGQNTNATRYNMSEIICDEVVERAIKEGALEKVEARDLRKCLSVTPVQEGNPYDKDEYHISTEFLVTFEADKKTRHLNAENVVVLIANAYKKFYIEKYAYNFGVLDIQIDYQNGFQEMDYLDIVQYLDMQVQKIENYMFVLANESPSFISADGSTFYSLAQKCTQLKDIQIDENLKSYLLTNGVSKNADKYIGRLEYDNTLTDYETRKAKASFQIRNEAVSMYAEEMTRVVLVPTWDTDGEYYMGRTKVGIDTLSVEAEDYSKKSADYLKEIETNKAVINALEGTKSNRQDATADRLVEEISITITELAKNAKSVGQEYSETQMNKCMSESLVEHSFFRTVGTCIIFGVLFFLSLNLSAISSSVSKNTKHKTETNRKEASLS
ncbi:hypothetical protein [Lacrimispora sp. 210928-DFI.3.58]|uniref:hypothetical protein n=1 Tax=Lacrimispora sp. 210928-DFI.3.58 TaxID=2883214 RepID=UPI001D06AA70|nr:hypothetical protein [Lacrimispora sp. 210928-DFI.3.58]MCB7319428.1 hypothetical protein [Lacrimispora sp. 210928-DFI.3.58]